MRPSPSDRLPPDVPAEVLAPIVADAATRAGVDPADVRVIEAWAAEWNDGALGCPEPNVFYTQAIVNGWQVIVEANGQTLDYRALGPGAFRVCPAGGIEPSGGYWPRVRRSA